MIENAELVMHMLEMYQMYKQQVPVELEEYLRYVAKTGNTLFQWTLVKPFIREKILNVIAEFIEQSTLADIPPYPNVDPFNYEAMKTILLERFDTFNGPPFTIQRLCELLSCPRKEYNRVDKFMRAVEKNILVVSTCELRSKREEPIVNGVPERWENGKESDVNMDTVNKSNIISDENVINGSETVESLLNELESMKTPETKLDEIKTDHSVTQVPDKIESNVTAEASKQDTEVLISDGPQTQITDSTEILDKANISHIPVDLQTPIVDSPKEKNSDVCEIQPIEINEQITENVIKEPTDLHNDINLESELKTEKPITEINKLDQPELLQTDTNRVEGSIIHQTPDSDNKLQLDIIPQTDVLLVKPNESIENMDVEVEDVNKSVESEINCNKKEEFTVTTGIENDKEDKILCNVLPINTVSTKMDITPERLQTEHLKLVETILINDECAITKPFTILKSQEKEKLTNEEENKIIEPYTIFEETQENNETLNDKEIPITDPNTIFDEPQENKPTESE